MLIGRDLGLPNLVVLVAVFVILPAIGLVIRSKWRHAAARSEEIKRLLVFASEEAARAEIEATEGYYYSANTSSSVPSPDSAWIPAPDSAWVPAPESPWVPAPAPASVPEASPSKPSYQCAVCFSPANTRCAKCKAARYCSGRCQIVHWRQGHKDECRPYVAAKPIKDESNSSFKQDDDIKGSNNISLDENRPENGSFFQSPSESSSEEYSTFSTPTRSSIETTSDSSYESDKMDSNQFADVKSEHQPLTNPANKSNGSDKINQNQYNLGDEDIQPVLSRSSSRDDDGSNGPSFAGSIHSKKLSTDDLNVFEPLDQISKKGVTVNSAILDNSVSNGPKSKKSNDEISSSNKLLSNDPKSTKPPKYTSKTLTKNDVIADKSMLKKTKISPSEIKDSAISEKSNQVVNNPPPVFKPTRVVSSSSFLKTSDTHLISSTNKLTSQSTKPVTIHEEKIRVTENAKNGLKTSVLKVVDQFKPSKLTRHFPPRAESDSAHKYNCKISFQQGLFSYEMFVKLYNCKVELRPFGLINCGNSCYANAVLQCLTYTPPLNAYFLQGVHSKACDKKEWCLTCEFENLVLKGKMGYSPLSPIRLLSQIENRSNLGHGKEEDAHEFLRYAIDTLQSVCLKEARTNTSDSDEETTLIGLTFGGYLRSKIKCMKCGVKSETDERMMDLTVEIEGNIGTLEEALDKFTCTELLEGENKYKCSRCKSYEKAKKKLTILEAPNVLTIALKRFQSGKFGKLNKSIRYPEILDMAPYVSGTSDTSPVYRLYGVVVHVDIMNDAFSGHYVCYVKNFENRWFKLDDSRVKEVDVQSVLIKGAYMLLYARCSPRAPRLIRNPKKHKMAPSSFTSREPWDVNHGQMNHGHINHGQLPVRTRTLEEESTSSSDGSGIFSESCSCSTDRDSTNSIEEWDWEHEYNNINSYSYSNTMHMNSSDSDTSSSSSFPSLLYPRHSHLYHENDEFSFSSSGREPNFDRLGGRPVNNHPSKPILRRSTTRARSD